MAAASEMQSFTVFEGHHRDLKEHLERLSVLVSGGGLGDASVVASLRNSLTDLKVFSEVHFASEEKLMEDVRFPGLAGHQIDHRGLLDWLGRLIATTDDNPRRLATDQSVTALVTWWEAHARSHDRPLADFMCRGGI